MNKWLCRIAIKHDIHNFEKVPNEYKDHYLCLRAIKNGLDLNKIPKELIDQEILYFSKKKNNV